MSRPRNQQKKKPFLLNSSFFFLFLFAVVKKNDYNVARADNRHILQTIKYTGDEINNNEKKGEKKASIKRWK